MEAAAAGSGSGLSVATELSLAAAEGASSGVTCETAAARGRFRAAEHVGSGRDRSVVEADAVEEGC